MRRTRRRALPRHIVSPRRRLVFGIVLGVLATVVLCVWVNPLSAVLALAAERVLPVRLHDAAQAPYDPEHRLGRSRRLLPGADRLDRRDRLAGLGAGRAVPGRLLLDPAAHLGAGAALPRGLRRRRRPDAAGGRASAEVVARQIVALLLGRWSPTSLLLWPVADTGWFYPVAALVLGAVFLVQAHRDVVTHARHRGPRA